MILCDLPYGITSAEWDKVIDIPSMWSAYNRIIKDHGAICLFSKLPFACDLINGNRKNFRYEWIWEKTNRAGFLNANRMPLRIHENILIFYKHLPEYHPQFAEGKPYFHRQAKSVGALYHDHEKRNTHSSDGKRYPADIIKFANSDRRKQFHPTWKPVELLEYLVKTYTSEGDVVLDNCMGSGSTGVACVNTNRDFIGMELDENFYQIAEERILEAVNS